ncbi:ATP-binding cassette domain-containing protein [Kitasatospora camelliae]|uniref:ATP-binding cassette domain-containing protein n=1 Tax=Kitasatospora camelliae TaxID=3156397 RepID=A0AAU8JWP6_9ACTN
MIDRRGGATVATAGLSLRGARGWVYQEIGFQAQPGELVVFEGPAGSGRTSLLLTLAGRMRPTAGTAEVDGLPLPAQAGHVREFTALGPMAGVNELDDSLSVSAHLRERQLLHMPLIGLPARRETFARAHAALAATGLVAERLPAGLRTAAGALTLLDRFRLGMALALMGQPRLVCVDDVDDRLHSAERAAAWQLLRAVADGGVTVLAATTDTAHAALGLADRTVHMLGEEHAARFGGLADARV